MPVSHIDFLDYSSTELTKPNPSEFQLRNASSRAYYALFHKARERIAELNLTMARPPNGGSHVAVVETIRRAGPKAEPIAVQMDRLKRFRHNCDYDLQLAIREGRVTHHVATAKRLIEMLDHLQKSPVNDAPCLERAAVKESTP